MGGHALLQGIFPTGIESSYLALQADSLPSEPPEKSVNTGEVAYPFSRGTSWTRNQTRVSCIAGRLFTSWTTREAPECPFHHRVLECKSMKSRIPGVTGIFDLGVHNEAGQRLTEFYQENALVIANTLFQQHKRQLYTGTSPDRQYWNQIDYILCSKRWRISKQSVKQDGSWLWLKSCCKLQT